MAHYTLPASVQTAQPPAHPPFRFPIRVYWEDTDAGGVVFYANYLKFFERARTEWLRSLGHAQEALRIATGSVFVVSETAVRYLRPARLDDLLEVTVEVSRAGRAQMTIAQQAWRPGASTGSARTGAQGGAASMGSAGTDADLLAEGTIRIACVDAETFRPCRISDAILASVGVVDGLNPVLR